LKTVGTLYIPAGTRQAYVEKGWNMYFANIVEMDEGDPIWLSIIDAEHGKTELRCEAGKVYTFRFKAFNGWRVHSVSFKGADVTSWLTEDGEFTTPAMSSSTELNVAYEQIATDVKAIPSSENQMRVFVSNGQILVKNAKPGTALRVFDLNGHQLGSATATEGTTAVDAQTAEKVVIVQVGSRSVKVAL